MKLVKNLPKNVCWPKPMQASILTMLENARWYLDAYENGFWVLKMSSWFDFLSKLSLWSLGFLELKNLIQRTRKCDIYRHQEQGMWKDNFAFEIADRRFHSAATDRRLNRRIKPPIVRFQGQNCLFISPVLDVYKYHTFSFSEFSSFISKNPKLKREKSKSRTHF